MVEIILKPKAPSLVQFFLQYHPFTNPCFKRSFDEISHWSRQILVLMLVELDLLITLLASIGVLTAFNAQQSKSPAPAPPGSHPAPAPAPAPAPGTSGTAGTGIDFIGIWTNPVAAGIAILIFLAVPIILFVWELIWETLIKMAENEEKGEALRKAIYLVFIVLTFGFFFGLLATLLALGLTHKYVIIQVAVIIFCVRFVIAKIFTFPIWLVFIYLVRARFGKERPSGEPDVRYCPGLFCCVSDKDSGMSKGKV